MMKFDYNHYQKLLSSFDLEEDPYDPHMESYQRYLAISDNFDPIGNPPEPGQEKTYVLHQVVPILQEYAKNFQAQLVVEDTDSTVRIDLTSEHLVIVNDDKDFLSILMFASSFFILPCGDYVKLRLYFNVV